MTKPTIREILSPGAPFEVRFIPNLKDLTAITQNLRESGYRVVLTQGVYDLVHEGHGKYLERAKAEGDVLIVGVDSDELTRHRKGPSRPIVPETERLRMLTLLRSVDIVTLRTLEDSDKDIDYLTRALNPDVFVMSKTTKDFPLEKQEEISRHVGKICVFEQQAETSTTARIRNLMVDGATELEKRLMVTIQQFLSEMKGG